MRGRLKHNPDVASTQETARDRPNITSVHWFLLGLSLVSVGIVLGLRSGEAEATRSDAPLAAPTNLSSTLTYKPGNTITVALPLPPDETPAIHTGAPRVTADQENDWRTITIKEGDNLATIFLRNNINPQQLHAIMAIGKEAATLTHLRPGETLKIKIDGGQKLRELVYEMDSTHLLHVQPSEGGYKATTALLPLEHRIAHASGTIDSSLFVAAQKAGLSDNLTMVLAGIFGWDIDFALDIRQGDSFSVIYDEVYLDGRKLRDGDVIAAEFYNRGTTYRAVLYTDENGRADYYTPEGMSMRKAFLRTPVDFTRISSRFSAGRDHPILHHIRAHKGVDYAAPIGTPVKATGDGTIVFRGVKGGYGNVVVLQHGSRYNTLYAHLSRFGRGIYEGGRVRQGQVIAYVGQTGLATGPHLHYEFRIDDVHRNPLTVKLPDALPIPERYRADFLGHTRPLLAQLDLIKGTAVAFNNE